MHQCAPMVQREIGQAQRVDRPGERAYPVKVWVCACGAAVDPPRDDAPQRDRQPTPDDVAAAYQAKVRRGAR